MRRQDQGGLVHKTLPLASCSIAAGKKEGGSIDGGKIHIEEFGTIYLASVIFKPSYRRISMLRVELGCPIGGSRQREV